MRAYKETKFFWNRFAKLVLSNAETLTMTDFPNILKTDIITSENDVFWDENIDIKGNYTPKKVLIISLPFDENSAESMQLKKMLAACKLGDDDINTVQITDTQKTAWHYLKHALQPATVILLGVMPANLGISAMFRFNTINQFDNTVWIPTLALEKLEQDPESKKALWVNALKPLFADEK